MTQCVTQGAVSEDGTPYVVVELGGRPVRLDVEDARKMALAILESAQSAETFAFFVSYFGKWKDRTLAEKVERDILSRMVKNSTFKFEEKP